MRGIESRTHAPISTSFRIPTQRKFDQRSSGVTVEVGPRVVAGTHHVVNFHLFDVRLTSVGADLPPSLVIGLVAKNHREVRVRQGVVELRVPFIVFDRVRRSGLKQGLGHSRLPIVFIDLTMATRAKPGVDVFIYWSGF